MRFVSPRVVVSLAVLTAALIGTTSPCLASDGRWPLAGGKPVRQLVPDPGFDVEHYAIHLDFDRKDKRVNGRVTIRGRAVAAPLRRVLLHAVDLDIESVTDGSGQALPFENTGEELLITPPHPLAAGEEFVAEVTYSCHPAKGIFFVDPRSDPDMKTRHEIWTQGERMDNRNWMPCWDYPNDRATTELWLTIPEKWESMSNGKLADSEPGPRPGTVTHHWVEDFPHVSYLTSFVVGNYEKRTDEVDGIPLEYMYPPGEWSRFERIMRLTPDMMRFYNRVTGYRYPYAKYGQVTTTSLFAAMENVGATTFETRYALVDSNAYPTTRVDHTTAHELAHQWFGDLITCRDWSHIWLNEGFATYFDALYTEYLEGADEFAMRMRSNKSTYMSEDENKYRRPIVDPIFTSSMDLFDRHTYRKGAWVLHQLRDVLTDFETGDDGLFWRGISHYTNKYANQTVRTDQFRLAMEEASGRDLGWFFDQWIFKAGFPEIEVTSEWKEDRGMLEIRVEQTQEVDSLTPLYRFPVTIEIVTDGGSELHREWLSERIEVLSYAVAGRPRYIRFDRDNHVLKKLTWEREPAALISQLEDAPDAEGRMEACAALGELAGDSDIVAILRKTLLEDSFYGVRTAAASALAKVKGSAALAALIEGLDDPDARVRNAVARKFADFPDDPRASRAATRALSDANVHVAASAISSIGQLAPGNASSLIDRALGRSSYRSVVRDSALRAIAHLGDTGKLDILQRWTKRGRPIYARAGAVRALGKLGSELASGGAEERRRSRIREHLVSLLSEPSSRIQYAAIVGLGSLGDPAAIPILTRIRDGRGGEFALSERARPLAYTAIRDITNRQALVADRVAVLDRLQKLEEQNRKLENEIDELAKQLSPQGSNRSSEVSKR